ncbi:hypothetical protein PHJA_001156600 [Phtheirospermum japonicum]|uniref:Uncharacterized protein n=1 Tax=Phtheirospermum japonicum TaxID=374723 RepID=A0A830BQY0_9LAMI|nr:hypothetical protein PHJA_001156600 [Phtheirospermum japonicum]
MMYYVLWTFKPCIDAFAHCRSVLSVDGTHLYKNHPGIISCTREMAEYQPPRVFPRFCLRHVCANVHSQFKNIKVKDLCWIAGAAVSPMLFRKIIEDIKKISKSAYAYLERMDKIKWTLSHDGGKCCGVLTTNVSECMNSIL